MSGTKRNQVPPPAERCSSGEVTFNYKAYDGRLLLGEAPFAFETQWSAGSDKSLHLYNDRPSISGIAIVEKVTKIGDVTPDHVAFADFSSRSRLLHIGQVAVIENQDGNFAALQLLHVQRSTTPSESLARLQYVIQTDGSSDFSKTDDAANADEKIAALLEAARDAKTALKSIGYKRSSSEDIPGIGHNQPPDDMALSEQERDQAVDALGSIEAEIASPSPSQGELNRWGAAIAKAAKAVGLWLVSKMDLAVDEAVKYAGKAAGVAAVGYVTWAAIQGKLAAVVQLLAEFTAYL